MRHYECYVLNEQHHFRDVEFLTEVDDGAAIATSRRLFAVRVDYAGFEVWQGERLLAVGRCYRTEFSQPVYMRDVAVACRRLFMIEEREIWRAASFLVRDHGAEAALIAARRSVELLAIGNIESGTTWKRILEAVTELSRTRPGKGELLN